MKNIVVFGQNRSGTKYLTNLIATSFDFACIQSDEHGGVIESNIHSYYANNFPGVLTSNEKVTILESFKKEYSFTKSKLSVTDLDKIKWTSCLDFFFKFYYQNAVKLNKKGWVQKVSSVYLDNFKNENVFRIVVQRNSLDVLNSGIKAFNLNTFQAIKRLFAINLMHKYEHQSINKNTSLFLNYSNLIHEPKICIAQISEFIGLSSVENSGIVRFNNSSFKHGTKKRKNPVFKLFDFIFKMIIFFIPISVINKRNKKNLQISKTKLVANSLDPNIAKSELKDLTG
jgi:Sulfotransferase domain